MDISQEVPKVKELLPQVNQVVIFLPDNASRDMVASALSLSLSLQQIGKTTNVVYPRPAIVGWSHLIGVNKLVQSIGNKNFVISLDYIEGSIEKVSYNIEGNKFNLVIEPKPGTPPFDENKVSYSHTGMAADLIVTIGVQTPEQLGKYYSENVQLFKEKSVLTIDHKGTARFGKINLAKSTSSVAEIMTQLIKLLQLPINSDIASNLYDGLVSGSRNFTILQANADTFELAAWVLRQGARKAGIPRQEELPDKESATAKNVEAAQTPPDWLQSKIYKSSSQLV